MSPGTPADAFRGTPGSSLTAAAGQRQPLLITMPSSFSLVGKTAMKMAGQIAEEWTVGPIMASHLTHGGDDALIPPFFNSKLPHQHITPFLTDINDVREPFRFEFTAILETDVTGGSDIASASDFERQFKNAFERRRPTTTKKNEEAEEGANEPPGLFQRFIDRRRNVRGDRIGKPLAKFIALSKGTVPGIGEEHGVWRSLSEKRSADDCFFFTRPGAKELFKEIFRPPLVNGRMVLSITQLCMLDVSAMMSGAGKKAKGKGYEGQVRALGTELCDEIWSLGGHPCHCCWTADVGGLGDEGMDGDEAADNGSDGEEENEVGEEKVHGDRDGNVEGDSDGGADAENSDHEGKERGDGQKVAKDA